jgi:hypothetical protein
VCTSRTRNPAGMRITGEYPRLSRHEKLITIIALKTQQNKLLGSVDPWMSKSRLIERAEKVEEIVLLIQKIESSLNSGDRTCPTIP